MGFSEKPVLSERNPHYLRAHLKNGLYLSTHLFTKEHARSQDCIRTSDDLKMRLEKSILFARADNDSFSYKPTLSARADNVGFSQINRAFLKKLTLSVDNLGFS